MKLPLLELQLAKTPEEKITEYNEMIKRSDRQALSDAIDQRLSEDEIDTMCEMALELAIQQNAHEYVIGLISDPTILPHLSHIVVYDYSRSVDEKSQSTIVAILHESNNRSYFKNFYYDKRDFNLRYKFENTAKRYFNSALSGSLSDSEKIDSKHVINSYLHNSEINDIFSESYHSHLYYVWICQFLWSLKSASPTEKLELKRLCVNSAPDGGLKLVSYVYTLIRIMIEELDGKDETMQDTIIEIIQKHSTSVNEISPPISINSELPQVMAGFDNLYKLEAEFLSQIFSFVPISTQGRSEISFLEQFMASNNKGRFILENEVEQKSELYIVNKII
jgi:hypothetical protein